MKVSLLTVSEMVLSVIGNVRSVNADPCRDVQLSYEIFINIRPMNSGGDLSPPSSCKIPNKVTVLSVVLEIKHEERQKDMLSLYMYSLRPVDYDTK
jgi:hypothetical protein